MSERFEFAHEPTLAYLGVIDAGGEVVRAQVTVFGDFGEHMPDDYDQGVRGGDGRLRGSLLAQDPWCSWTWKGRTRVKREFSDLRSLARASRLPSLRWKCSTGVISVIRRR